MYVLKNLYRLQDRPKGLQEKVFKKLFNVAEIAKLKPEDMKAYEESLKVYRDNYSAIETVKNDTKMEIAKAMKKYGDPIEKISAITGLTKEQIEKL